jgi:hypothetical protein
MRTTVLSIACALGLVAFTAGCESNNQPSDQSNYAAGRAGGNGSFGEGTANPGEHSDQNFRNSIDNSAASVPTTQPSR